MARPATTSSWPTREAGGSGAGSNPSSTPLGRVEAADQQQVAALEVARVGGVGAVAAPLERVARRLERLRRPPRSRETSAISASAMAQRARATASRGPKPRAAAPEQRLGAGEVAELRHRDAAQRQRRRIVAQGDVVQRAERVARGERARRGGDQRVHANPDTLVTPGRRGAGGKSIPRSTPGKPPHEMRSAPRASKGRTKMTDACDRNPRTMAGGAARSARRREGSDAARATTSPGCASACPGSGSTRPTGSTPRRAARH